MIMPIGSVEERANNFLATNARALPGVVRQWNRLPLDEARPRSISMADILAMSERLSEGISGSTNPADQLLTAAIAALDATYHLGDYAATILGANWWIDAATKLANPNSWATRDARSRFFIMRAQTTLDLINNGPLSSEGYGHEQRDLALLSAGGDFLRADIAKGAKRPNNAQQAAQSFSDSGLPDLARATYRQVGGTLKITDDQGREVQTSDLSIPTIIARINSQALQTLS